MHYPVALEGALKLKEISYIHAEAYPAGELKHGPLALVTAQMPVVAIAPNDALLEKLESNLQEVRARGGELFVFADADTRIRSRRRRARHPHARALRRAVADPARRAAAAARVPHRGGARHRRRQAEEPGEERDGRVTLALPSARRRACRRRHRGPHEPSGSQARRANGESGRPCRHPPTDPRSKRDEQGLGVGRREDQRLAPACLPERLLPARVAAPGANDHAIGALGLELPRPQRVRQDGDRDRFVRSGSWTLMVDSPPEGDGVDLLVVRAS